MEILLLFNLLSDFTFFFGVLNVLLWYQLYLGVAITIFSGLGLFIAANHILHHSNFQFSMSYAFTYLFLIFMSLMEIIL